MKRRRRIPSPTAVNKLQSQGQMGEEQNDLDHKRKPFGRRRVQSEERWGGHYMGVGTGGLMMGLQVVVQVKGEISVWSELDIIWMWFPVNTFKRVCVRVNNNMADPPHERTNGVGVGTQEMKNAQLFKNVRFHVFGLFVRSFES